MYYNTQLIEHNIGHESLPHKTSEFFSTTNQKGFD